MDYVIDELKKVKELVKHYQATISKISQHTFEAKSLALQEAIMDNNKMHPEYAPINNVYAFEASYGAATVQITLGYLLHAIRKARYKGGHILEIFITDSNKWDQVDRMIQAYEDMLLSMKM